MLTRINYLKQKRKEKDYCNICGNYEKLTWDHVPPKCVTHSVPVIANTVFEELPNTSKYLNKYQNGIQFRSLCEYCNNVVIGQNDIAYKEFIDNVIKMLSIDSVSRERVTVSARINRVCRAMVGHMLAAKNEYHEKTLSDVKMREYILDDSKTLTDFNLYTWFYFYRTICIVRDIVCKGLLSGTHPEGFMSFISSYPLAYLVTDQDCDCGIDNLGQYTTSGIDDIVNLKLDLSTVYIKDTKVYKPFNWPIDIGNSKNDAAFAIGGSSMVKDSRLGIY